MKGEIMKRKITGRKFDVQFFGGGGERLQSILPYYPSGSDRSARSGGARQSGNDGGLLRAMDGIVNYDYGTPAAAGLPLLQRQRERQGFDNVTRQGK